MKLVKQSQRYSCVLACIAMLANKDEQEIIENTGRNFYTSGSDIEEVLEYTNRWLDVIEYSGRIWPLKENDLPEVCIISIVSSDCVGGHGNGHAIVKYKDKYYNPGSETGITKNIPAFKSGRKRFARWYISVKI